MNAFSSLTIWIILATVIPGLITIACVFIIINWVFPHYSIEYSQINNWFGFSIVVAIMIITQSFGVGLESILQKTFPKKINSIKITNPTREKVEIAADDEYKGLYCVISGFKEGDDKHGHIQRIIGQYFLTANILVSYLAAILIVTALVFFSNELYPTRIIVFLLVMVLLCAITLFTLRMRYKVMIQSLWTIRNIIVDRNKGSE